MEVRQDVAQLRILICLRATRRAVKYKLNEQTNINKISVKVITPYATSQETKVKKVRMCVRQFLALFVCIEIIYTTKHHLIGVQQQSTPFVSLE